MSNTVYNAHSCRTRIRQALLYLLKQISIDNGYKTNVSEVHDEALNFNNIKRFPAIVLTFATENILEYGVNNQTFVKQFHELRAFLDCFVYERETPSFAREELIHDLEKLIGVNHGLPGEDGKCTCYFAQPVSIIPFGMKSNLPYVGFSMELLIKYAQKRDDPTVRTQ